MRAFLVQLRQALDACRLPSHLTFPSPYPLSPTMGFRPAFFVVSLLATVTIFGETTTTPNLRFVNQHKQVGAKRQGATQDGVYRPPDVAGHQFLVSKSLLQDPAMKRFATASGSQVLGAFIGSPTGGGMPMGKNLWM